MQEISASNKAAAKGVKVFTTVLLPTPQSVEEEVFVWSNTPDPRANNRKQPQASVANRTPASATMPHPPTPLSAVPSTPVTGPPPKKQKMILGESDMRNFQSKLTTTTAAPLLLDPVDSLQEAGKLIQRLTDSLHKGSLPSPKTRKRTVAELEADEAQAASEQRFMLIMDERLANSGAGTKANGGDGEAGAAAFEPSFERFRTIERIKATQREKEHHMQEQRAANQAQQQAANRLKQDQAEQHRLMQEKKATEMAQRASAMRAFQASSAQNQQPSLAAFQHQQQMAASQNLHGHGPTANGVMPNQQHVPPNPQTQHSSPVSRHMTPHSNPRSSPLVGSVPHSVPMNVTSSGQGVTSSPARPPSAAQHGHPAGGVAMVPNRSQQRPESRMGTPSMPNGTPGMQHGTPVTKQATPTPRMNHGSPPNGMTHTPMMNASSIAAQHINGQQLTPEQAAQYERFQRQQHELHQAQLRQHHAAQQNLANGMSPAANHGMSPMHMPPNQNSNLQQLAAQNNQNIRAYNARQQEFLQRQMAGNHAAAGQGYPQNPNFPSAGSPPNPHGRPMPPQPPQHPGGGAPPQNPQQLAQQRTVQEQAQAQLQMQFQHSALA
ncbi:MAG: hypothetical protein Q9201_007872, partial [Fulgogasparrea decipioides]